MTDPLAPAAPAAPATPATRATRATRATPSVISADAHWRRLEELFDAALPVPDARRSAWLASQCGDDRALCAELERMLDAHRRTGGILDRPPVAVTPGEIIERLRRALAGRYTIEEELGRGGMAVVFLATERKHARRVVLKVLRPEVAAWYGTERFVREVGIAARLAHPHIVGLIDSGDADGLLYYVMPHVDGETLRTRLIRDTVIAPETAALYLRDIARALAHAHGAGVVHRDLKPENVLCAGEHVFVLDFGVAKVFSDLPDGSQAGVDITATHTVIGTPAYMAPEQFGGDRPPDHRVDLYAWGVLAYEMLVGRLPDAAVARQGIVTTADPLRRAPIPAALAAVVQQCLAVDPADRPADFRAVLASLAPVLVTPPGRGGVRREAGWRRHRTRALAAFGGVMVVAGLLLHGPGRPFASGATGTPAGSAGAGSLDLAAPAAVVALVNETGDASLDPWGRLAGDWITQGLQETGVIAVVPWSTMLGLSARVQGGQASGGDAVALMRDETGAGTVVTGSYYLADDSLRFIVEIVDARGNAILGAPPPVVVARDSASLAILTLRDRVMSSVAIWANARLETSPDLARRPPSFAAYQAFDRALARFVDQGYAESAPEFREAYALDTTFLVPLIYAATAHWNSGEVASADSLGRLLRARRGELSRYHQHLAAFIEARIAGDGERALLSVRAAAALAPGSRAWYNLAAIALEMDRPDEALTALAQLDPDRGDMRGWSSYWTQLTHALHLTGAHERELAAARELRRRFPDRRVGWVLEARALAAQHRLAELAALHDAARSLPPAVYWSQGAALVVAGEELLSHGDAGAGRAMLQQGIDWLQEQLVVTPDDIAHRYWLGSAYYGLERWPDADRVFTALAADRPDRLDYRGLAAVAAARTGTRDASRVLGEAAPHERGLHAIFRARIAAIRGAPDESAPLFGDAVRDVVDGLPWMHASAFHELRMIGDGQGALPRSLRVAGGRAGVP